MSAPSRADVLRQASEAMVAFGRALEVLADREAASSEKDPDLNVYEAAERMRKSPSYVRGLCRGGRIACRKEGRDWLIPESAVEARRRAGRRRAAA